MQTAKNGDTVKVHYTGTLDDGTTFDSSVGKTPLEFKLGEGQLLKDFEVAVLGLSVGESKKINIAAKDGYGLYEEKLVGKVPLSELPDDIQPELGMKLQMQTPDGHAVQITITELTESDMTVDANHELAGKDLNFDIELVEIRA